MGGWWFPFVQRREDLSARSLGQRHLAGAWLVEADLSETELEGSDLSGARLDGARCHRLQGPGLRLTDASLCMADLSEAELADGQLERVAATGVCLEGANLDRVRLWGADLSMARLRAARLRGASLDGLNLEGADLSAADLSGSTGQRTVLDRARLQGADLSAARLLRASLRGADLRGANLRDADLRRADLRGADLGQADLSGTRLDGARLEGARLDEALLDLASAKGLRLRQLPGEEQAAALRSAGAQLGPAPWLLALSRAWGSLRSRRWVPQVALPALPTARLLALGRWLYRLSSRFFSWAGSFLGEALRSPLEALGPGAELQGRNFTGLRLAGMNLSGADLSGARLVGTDLNGADLTGAKLVGARLEGVTLDGTQLAEADLSRAQLQRSSLRRADLRGARLFAASFSGTDLGGAELAQADARGVRLINCALVGAELVGVDLRAAVLQDCDLRHASLDDLRLAGAELQSLRGLSKRRLEALLEQARQPCDLVELGLDVGSGEEEQQQPVVRESARERLRRAASAGSALLVKSRGSLRRSMASLREKRQETARARRQRREEKRAQRELARREKARLTEEKAAQERAAQLAREEEHRQARARKEQIRREAQAREEATRREALARAEEPVAPEGPAEPVIERQLPERPTWLLRVCIAVGLGLVLVLAIKYTDYSSVADQTLEEQAISAAERGDASEAAERYRELVARAPDARSRATWLLELASALERAEGPQSAIEALQEAQALELSDEDLRLRISLRVASLHASVGRHQLALAAYQAILDDSNTSAEFLAAALVGACDACLALDQPQTRAAILNAAFGAYPEQPEAALALARRSAEILRGRYRAGEALELLELLPTQEFDPSERASWQLARARALDELGRFDDALQAYDSALAGLGHEGSAAWETRYEVARLRYRRGDLQVAAEMLQALEASATVPEMQGRALLMRAEILRQRGADEQAASAYRRVLESWPEDEDLISEARNGLGALMAASEDESALDALVAELDQGGSASRAASDVLLGRANGLLELGEAGEALALFERVAASFDSSNRWVLAADNGRASALIELDRFSEALELLRSLRGRAEADRRLDIDAQIGEVLLRSGQVEEAERAYQSLLEVATEQGRGITAARLGLAAVAEVRGQNEEAATRYSQVALEEEQPEIRVAALRSLVSLYLELGRDEEAMDAFHRLEDLLEKDDPALVDIRLAMAEIWARNGDLEKERQMLEEVLAHTQRPLDRGRARVRLAELLNAQAQSGATGDPAASQQALEAWRALRADPQLPQELMPDVVYGEVLSLVELGRHEDALERLEQALTDGSAGPDPDVLLTLKRQALAALGHDDEAEAIELEDGGLDEAQAEAMAQRLQEAVALRDAGQSEQALAIYRELLDGLEDRPAQASIHREIALAQAADGRHEQARASLAQLGEEYADLPEARFMAGYTLAEMDLAENDPQAALARLRRLEAPDDGHQLWQMESVARAHAAAGDLEAARGAWREILTTYAGEPSAAVTAWSGLGELFMANGDPQRAVAAYQRASVVAPEGSLRDQARLRLAGAQMEIGALEDAHRVLDAVRDESDDEEILLQVGLASSALLQEEGDWKGALQAVQDLSVAGLGAEYAAQVADARAVCLLALQRSDDAQRVYKELEREYPGSAEVRITVGLGLAEVEAARGDIQAAAERYQQLALETKDRFRQGQALLRLAQMYEVHGRSDDAKRIYRRLRDEYRDEPELAEYAATALE